MGTDSTKKPFKVRSQARRGNVQCANELNNFFNCLTVRLINQVAVEPELVSLVFSLQRTTDLEFDTACARDAKALTDCATAAVRLRAVAAATAQGCP